MALISNDINLAVSLLKHDVVAIPTETVYGLAANALDSELVLRIFEVKKRPAFDPLIVHVATIQQAERFVSSFPVTLKNLAEKFWPGPLTLLLPKNNLIPDIVTSGLGRVGVRIPDHPLTLELLNRCDFPLAAPSANPFGYISPTKPEHVQQQLGNLIPLILDGGPCRVGMESTIAGLENEQLTIYRLGGIPLEAIEAVAGKTKLMLESGSNPGAPGMLVSHYAPRKPLLLSNENFEKASLPDAACFLIRFQQFSDAVERSSQFVLSEQGDLREAAIHLFEALHQAEAHKSSRFILAELVPDLEIGRAINDRLRRAARSPEIFKPEA